MPKLELTLLFKSPEWEKKLPKIRSLTKRALNTVLDSEEISTPVIQVSVVWADNAFVQDLNATYRGKNKPTNILSFAEYESRKIIQPALKKLPEIYLGDMVLAWETIVKEAIVQGKTLADHTSHLLVHGLLHLLGYDHEKESEAKVMEQKEINILKTLGIENPYEKY